MKFKKGHLAPSTAFKKGNIPWNKGKNVSESLKAQLSKSHTGKKLWPNGRIFSEETRRKMSESAKKKKPWLLGRKLSEEIKDKIRKSSFGHVAWNKGMHVYLGGKRFEKGQIPWNKEKPIFKKCLVCEKEFTDNPARMKVAKYCSMECYIPQLLQRVAKDLELPTKFEKKIINIIKRNNLPYKYTGNGDFWIGGKNPDFVNINGEKKLIEVGSSYWKNKSYGSVDNYIKERSEHFAQYGWKSYFYIEDDFNEKKFLNSLKGVINYD